MFSIIKRQDIAYITQHYGARQCNLLAVKQTYTTSNKPTTAKNVISLSYHLAVNVIRVITQSDGDHNNMHKQLFLADDHLITLLLLYHQINTYCYMPLGHLLHHQKQHATSGFCKHAVFIITRYRQRTCGGFVNITFNLFDHFAANELAMIIIIMAVVVMVLVSMQACGGVQMT